MDFIAEIYDEKLGKNVEVSFKIKSISTDDATANVRTIIIDNHRHVLASMSTRHTRWNFVHVVLYSIT